MKRDSGQVEMVTGMFLLIFLVLLLAVQLQLVQYMTTALYMEDALAASNLASAVIDLDRYGETHEIVIGDTAEAYERYRRALRDNLNLDDAWECSNKGLAAGRVEILDYTVYNVTGRDVEICAVGAEGIREWTVKDGLGTVTAPNGVRVEATGIYSEIGFQVKGILGVRAYARKGKLADVVPGA